MNRAIGNQGNGRLLAMRKPVRRSACGRRAGVEVREGSTGRVVTAMPVRLPQVWAVAEALPSAEATALPEAAALLEPKAELAFYRKYTEALLRRYMRMSMSAGRVPSLMGREMFRGHVTHYRAHTFEDVAIFCFDVERQIARLTPQQKDLVKRIALQQYTQMEVAGMLGVTLRHCVRLYGGTLDRLTELFLAAKLLEFQAMANAVKGVERCLGS